MGLQLPSELVTFLQMIGYNWPQADEMKMFEMGQRWVGFSSELGQTMAVRRPACRRRVERQRGRRHPGVLRPLVQ